MSTAGTTGFLRVYVAELTREDWLLGQGDPACLTGSDTRSSDGVDDEEEESSGIFWGR